MDIRYKSVAGNAAIDQSQGIVECFVAAVGNKDSVNDIILPKAFDGSLKRRKPRVVWGHDWNHPIGKVLDIFEVGPGDPRLPPKMKSAGVGGLYARVQFNLNSEKGREAFTSVAFYGEEQEWSIGYKTIVSSFDNEKQANLLKEVELFEVSPVLHGANQLTGTISVKSADWANPTTGIQAELGKSLAEFMRVPIVLREVKGADVLFDVVDEEEVSAFTTSYSVKDGEYTFKMATPLFVSAKGCNGNCECGEDKKPGECACKGEGGECACEKPVEEKVGRVLSSRNVKKLQDAMKMIEEVISAAGMEAKELSVSSETPDELLSFVSPVLRYHEISHETEGKTIRFKDLTEEGEAALRRAMQTMDLDTSNQ